MTLETLADDEPLAELFADLCEVELPVGEGEAPLFAVEGVSDLTVFARDGSGGQFVLSLSSGRIFLFGSEGSAGAIAENVAGFLALVVRMPYWRDVLHYSGGGQIEQMRRAAAALEDDFAYDDHGLMARETLIAALEIEQSGDIIAELHATSSSGARIRDQWGSDAEPLFGRFVIEDNPMMRRAT